MHTTISTIAIAVLAASSAAAEPVTLTAGEIADLLLGNTAIGDWSGTAYRQFFDESGLTIYAPVDGRAEHGRWRVNEDTGQYESHWERSGWSAYDIAQDGETYFWVQSNGKMQGFTVTAGNRLGE